ncbi:MBL fold metallo-hydrolase [Isoptericola chiayiensis]|uniref:MBL fold metallo-hydrolase n=1 Tax=Isoptericola chiayiensis TaxID=579446 RepID=A0ABP8YE19_9MICO|nr:MBL fold metallo-hydrolase [Isoptericola chiayiensis]NOW00055.1 glyoxylase-like metal-dependent hydrolase (beta-lactamase superfamily II) [Isoptericola chiayiensis]
MDVHVVVAPVFATNCCVVVADRRADDGRRDCVVVDPGAGTADAVSRLVEDESLRVRAVLATHGHVDHTWDAAELCARHDAPLRLHARDVYRVSDPFGTIGLGDGRLGAQAAAVSDALTQALADFGRTPREYTAPARVEPFDGDGDLVCGDVTLRARHAPGHTEGSTLYVLEAEGVVLSGDVLFAGSVGRTDLPGADLEAMLATLRDVVGRLDPAWQVVPGHGPTTTVGRELASNPFLPR